MRIVRDLYLAFHEATGRVPLVVSRGFADGGSLVCLELLPMGYHCDTPVWSVRGCERTLHFQGNKGPTGAWVELRGGLGGPTAHPQILRNGMS
jgi:hypothetical protein